MPLKDPEARRAYRKAYAVSHQEEIRQDRLKNRERNKAASLRNYYANREERLAGQARWREKNIPRRKRAPADPEKAKARQARYNQKYPEKKSAYYFAHSKEICARQCLWAKEHPDLVKASIARRRARKLDAPRNDLTAAEWQIIKETFDFRCAYCGKKPKRLEKDHITPLSKEGSHTLWNIVPCCRSCNAKKHTGPAPVPVQPLLL